MNKLVISLASRGRPELLAETIQRTVPNIAHPDTVMIIMADRDDVPTIRALEQTALAPHTGRVIVNVAEREDTVAEKFNRALAEPADVYLPMVDHSPQCTPGFDVKILEAATLYPDGICCVVNHLANASFSSIYAPTRKLIDKMGYLFPPYFPYWFVDHWLDDIMMLIGRSVFCDVVVDSSKKRETMEMREPRFWATFYDAGERHRRALAASIINGTDFEEPPWRKMALLGRHPVIEYRSRWVNNSVRQLQPATMLPYDDRYRRIKAAAIARLEGWLEGMNADEANAFRRTLVPPTTIVGLPRMYG